MGSRRGERNRDVPVATLPSDDPTDGIFLGVDFGTSGCRAVAINAGGELLAQAETPLSAPESAEKPQTRHSGGRP